MMLFIRLTGLLACVGILVFGVYKTVEGIRINEMIEEISTVVETTPLVPPVDLPDFGDPETPDEPSSYGIDG